MKEKYFQQPSVMNASQHFSQVPSAEIQRSRFDRSHAVKTTFDAGKLIPVFVDEVLPGDTFNVDATAFSRLATPLKPVMDNMYLDIHFFFVPYRLVWDNWTKFMGERPTPDFDPNTLSVPTISMAREVSGPNASQLNVSHYFGLPYVAVGGTQNLSVNALPFRAYNLIWNEWYRDQNLQQPRSFVTDDGPDNQAETPLTLAPRGKRHDYFTSCLPWPQKGDPVVVPLGDEAELVFPTGIALDTVESGATSNDLQMYPSGGTYPYNLRALAGPVGTGLVDATLTGDGPTDAYADLSTATAVSINDLRSAFQIQRLLERDARGGTRYIELILSHFGVRSSDSRLQRPEYLGGGTTRININPIAATVQQETVPQGNLAAIGTAIGNARFSKSFEEHGVVIGLASARADLTYQQGLERMWSRQTRYDFYWPALAHLGEQAVLNKEIFWQGVAADDEVFGYQERFAEYRYKPSRITGLFNSNADDSLDVWHLSQDFASLPALNASFIEENPPIDRIIAVPSEPHFLCDIWFDFKTDRPMPVYSVPGLIDHF
ncbi:MAG: major capsid protein [Candidatus Methanomethylicaceae archaeon]